MPLAEESKQFLAINAHQGLYRYTRLPFGMASAPALVQKAMDEILQGLPNVICYLSDIQVAGASDQEHLKYCEEVIARLKKN